MEMIDDFVSMIKTLRSGYHKHGIDHRFSRARERFRSGNSKANSKIEDYTS
ncbi:unnamed protein product, partial [marine sediment metagenome]